MERKRIVSSAEAPAVHEGRAAGRPRSEQAHDAILAAAIALIREIGYDAVGMEGIAARAGVGKATLYRRWRGKEELVTEALGRIMQNVEQPDTGSARGDLVALLRAVVPMYADPATGELLSGLIAAMVRNERIGRAVRDGFVATWRRAARTALEAGVARGEIRRRLDLELAVDMIAGPILYRFLITGGAIDDRLARQVVDRVLEGIAARE